jgi:hypothetical protein
VTLLNGCLEIEETPVTATVLRLEGYKFTLHLILITMSHPSLLLALGFFSFLLSANHQWRIKEAPPAPSGSPPPPGSPSSLFVDTSHDEQFTRKLFGDLNRNILGPPGNGKIIIIDDSDNDDEAQDEGTVGIEPTAVLASAADAPTGARVTDSDDQGSDQEVDGGDNSERSASEP